MSDPTPPADPPAGRIRITRGGAPSPAQIAALTVALTTALDPRRRGAGHGYRVGVAHPGWLLAALREGIGGPQVTDPADVPS